MPILTNWLSLEKQYISTANSARPVHTRWCGARRSERRPATSRLEAPPKARSYWQIVGYRLRYDSLTLCFGGVVLLIMLSAIGAPLLAPADPYQTSMMSRLKPFGYKGHLLGTDELGRDMLSRLLYGGRVSLTMGMVPVMLATLIGGMLGLVAGYAGRHLNMAIMWTMDVFYLFAQSPYASRGFYRLWTARPRHQTVCSQSPGA